MDKEFNAIFRRAFQSIEIMKKVPENQKCIIEQLGIKHVKGILLFGPPCMGKTLMARKISEILSDRPAQIVNIGESEANIRKLFTAIREEQRVVDAGGKKDLHIIIFDEIDAIAKQRGSFDGNSLFNDTVVSQLSSIMDGVHQLDNILIIGLTNRKDMIDEALLRRRFEVLMEIPLPDEDGRVEILNIHIAEMKKKLKLAPDVEVKEIAERTINFTGAELEGLVKAAGSRAVERQNLESPGNLEGLCLTQKDFINALENDIKPAFGSTSKLIDEYQSRGITIWSDFIRRIIDQAKLLIKAAEFGTAGVISLLLEGAPNAGKTTLAAHIAKATNFPFIRVCTPEEMVGFSEVEKCFSIRKVVFG